MMKLPVSTKLLLLICYISPALSASENSEEAIPSLEFLEFLGSFETKNGQWLDPMEIEKMIELSTQKIKAEENIDEQIIKQ